MELEARILQLYRVWEYLQKKWQHALQWAVWETTTAHFCLLSACFTGCVKAASPEDIPVSPEQCHQRIFRLYEFMYEISDSTMNSCRWIHIHMNFDLGDEHWNSYSTCLDSQALLCLPQQNFSYRKTLLTCLNFSIFNRPKKKSNTTQFILWFLR